MNNAYNFNLYIKGTLFASLECPLYTALQVWLYKDFHQRCQTTDDTWDRFHFTIKKNPFTFHIVSIAITNVYMLHFRFTPEQLGIQASSALVWLIIELVVIMLSLYIMNVNTSLKYTDVIAYCGYKFVGWVLVFS